MNSDDWLRRLRRAGDDVADAGAAEDAAYAVLDATIRATRHGRTLAHLVTVTGLSKPRIDEALAAPVTATPIDPAYGDTGLRIAAYAAVAATSAWLTARARRDVLILQAGVESGLPYLKIAEAARTSRRYEWQLRTGQLEVHRNSPRQHVFQGAGNEAARATENARLRRQRQDAKRDPASIRAHGLQGYRLGCRCDVCTGARRGVQDGTIEVQHGMQGYRHGCRCPVCSEQHAAYYRRWRRRSTAR
ncbi:hypothetical protein ABZS66_19295 [Dactylosporangium sp. NPDC005572]|uniref:hypothetical protein n=1 Tax=Dactylosporangium sp. NPDC005572 TaxID=3156889 RepID=UPI0033AC48B9